MISYHTSKHIRICKICQDAINKNTWAICFRHVHVSPAFVDLHFHEGCLMRALDSAKIEYGDNEEIK